MEIAYNGKLLPLKGISSDSMSEKGFYDFIKWLNNLALNNYSISFLFMKKPARYKQALFKLNTREKKFTSYLTGFQYYKEWNLNHLKK